MVSSTGLTGHVRCKAHARGGVQQHRSISSTVQHIQVDRPRLPWKPRPSRRTLYPQRRRRLASPLIETLVSEAMDEVAVVRDVLASMGVTDYDPKVATLLAEYLRRKFFRCRGWALRCVSRGVLACEGPASHHHPLFRAPPPFPCCRKRGRGTEGCARLCELRRP